MSYSKATSVAIKGDYTRGRDVPADERYTSITNQFYKKPTVRSHLDGTMNKDSIKLVETVRQKSSEGFFKPGTDLNTDGWGKSQTMGGTERTELAQSFKDILHLEKKPVGEVFRNEISFHT